MGEEEDLEGDVPILARKLVEKLQMPIVEAFEVSEALAERKVHRFGADPRTIASVDVVRDGDKLRVTTRSTV